MVDLKYTQKKRVSIKQVAAEAHVSTQTVSRVINGRPDVAAETRQRVQQVIERLGYRPSALARSLIQQRSYTIGVVTAGLRYIGPNRTLNGIVEMAESRDYSLILKELPSFEADDTDPVINSLLARQVDGIIWAVPEVGANHDWIQNRFSDIHIPIIFLTMQPRPDLPIVSVDNYSSSVKITNYLLDQGYRHIGHVAGPTNWWEARQRMAGWQTALAGAGIEATEQHWTQGNWSSASGERAFIELLDQYPEMDAVYVGNDQMALAVLLVAARKGLKVPEDLGVAGFDDIPESAYFLPPLTTINQDQHELGCRGLCELIDMIEAGYQTVGAYKPSSILLEPEMVVRESAAHKR